MTTTNKNTRNNIHPHSQPLWTNNRSLLDNKLLQLERDCFQEAAEVNTALIENDKENSRLIMNAVVMEMKMNGGGRRDEGDETDAILFKTLDGKVVKSVQAPGKGKPMVPIKVCGFFCLLDCLLML